MNEEIKNDVQTKSTSKRKWLTGFRRDLLIFLITFTINSIIVWLMTLAPAEYTLPVILYGVPLLGGIIRGSFSKTKHFLTITFVWALILALVYVPLYSLVYDSVENYGLYIIWGLIVAGIMLAASLVSFGIRYLIAKRKKQNSEKLKK